MDFVDEQHIAVFQVGQQRREVSCLGDHRAGGGAEIHAQFARHDLRQRGLAEAGRADEQHMVERLVARARRLDEDFQIGARLFLADKFRQPLRAQRGFREIVLAPFGSHQAGRAWNHRASSELPSTSPACGGGRRAKLAGRGKAHSASWDAPSPTLTRRRGRESNAVHRLPSLTCPIPSTRAGSTAWFPRPRPRCARRRRWRRPPADDHSRD